MTDSSRKILWIAPFVILTAGLRIWSKHSHEQADRRALAKMGTLEDPMTLMQMTPERLLCVEEAVCARFKSWQEAQGCSAKRTASAELEAAVGSYQAKPNFMPLAMGVVKVQQLTEACDAPGTAGANEP